MPMDRRRVFRTLAVLAAISTYATIVVGGSVSSNEAGLACPDWPLCNGQLIPDFSAPGVAIEYTHRLVAATTSLFVFLTALLAWFWLRSERRIVLLSTSTLAILVAQVVFGMLTITSRLNPAVVTTHLALATAVFASALAVAVLSLFPPSPRPEAAPLPVPHSFDEAVH